MSLRNVCASNHSAACIPASIGWARSQAKEAQEYDPEALVEATDIDAEVRHWLKIAYEMDVT